MDKELTDAIRDFRNFRKEWEDFLRSYNETRREMTELRREIGVREGRLMTDQIDELEKRLIRSEDFLTHIARDSISIRKLLEYNEVNVKEVMKAMSLIYRNTDELESGLLPNAQS